MQIPYQKKLYSLGDGGSSAGFALLGVRKRQVPVPARPSTLRPRMYVSHVRSQTAPPRVKTKAKRKEEWAKKIWVQQFFFYILHLKPCSQVFCLTYPGLNSKNKLKNRNLLIFVILTRRKLLGSATMSHHYNQPSIRH